MNHDFNPIFNGLYHHYKPALIRHHHGHHRSSAGMELMNLWLVGSSLGHRKSGARWVPGGRLGMVDVLVMVTSGAEKTSTSSPSLISISISVSIATVIVVMLGYHTCSA